MDRKRMRWPNSEGAWWMRFGPHECRCPVYARREGGEILVNNLFTHPVLRENPDWMTESEYLDFATSLEFIKCEPNPFPRSVTTHVP